jgi:PhnB protein
MPQVNVYIQFNGNTEEAFMFYRSIFGGKFLEIQRFDENPEQKVSIEDRQKIMHIAYQVGDNLVIHGADVLDSDGQPKAQGNNFHLLVEPDSREEVDLFFNKLSEDGTVTMPLQETYWGSYYGHCTDKFGIQWRFKVYNK